MTTAQTISNTQRSLSAVTHQLVKSLPGRLAN
jgi:hypothetical protein